MNLINVRPADTAKKQNTTLSRFKIELYSSVIYDAGWFRIWPFWHNTKMAISVNYIIGSHSSDKLLPNCAEIIFAWLGMFMKFLDVWEKIHNWVDYRKMNGKKIIIVLLFRPLSTPKLSPWKLEMSRTYTLWIYPHRTMAWKHKLWIIFYYQGPPQYKDHLSRAWGFPCLGSLTWGCLYW